MSLIRLLAFVDANILFSATYKPTSNFLRIWRIAAILPVTSAQVVAEVRRNIRQASHLDRFEAILNQTFLSPAAGPLTLPQGVALAEKDVHVLLSALASRADYLITGDKNHFRQYLGRRIQGTIILSPATFLRLYPEE